MMMRAGLVSAFVALFVPTLENTTDATRVMLETLGTTVISATDGLEALSVLDRQIPGHHPVRPAPAGDGRIRVDRTASCRSQPFPPAGHRGDGPSCDLATTRGRVPAASTVS